jgi:hypothetical protein
LIREFSYHRSDAGRIEVVDSFEFAQPSAFETALITYGDWTMGTDGRVTLAGKGAALEVSVQSDEGLLDFEHCVILESSTPTRLAWRFRVPVRDARIRMVIEPV